MVGHENCPSCSRPVTKDGLECDQCEHWFHSTCERISTDQYQVLGDIQSVWFCKSCSDDFRTKKNKPKADKSFQTEPMEVEGIKSEILVEIKKTIPKLLQQEIGKHLKTSFNNHAEQVQQLRGELKSENINLNNKLDSCLSYAKVTSKGLPINEQSISSIKQDFKEITAQHDKAIMSFSRDFNEFKTNFTSKQAEEKELHERELRSNNVCIFNVPESKSSDPETEAKDDSIKLQSIFKNKINLDKTDIKGIFRAGSKHNNKTRPIIIKLNSYQKKLQIVKLRNLQFETKDDSGTEATIPIFACPDRTKKQQEENRKLVQELKQKQNEDKDNKYIIDHKLKKVVRFVPFRPKSQFYWD